jgi:hypothetical protein
MRGIVFCTALLVVGAPVLAGCGLADSHAVWPESMRVKDNEPAPERPPDVKQLVRDHLDSVFLAASAPRDVAVSPVRRDLHGSGWTACVRADLNSATGKPLGVQTYRIIIENGVILDRQRIDANDSCASETYAPV